jgi:tetratricopeptide (TPR) repeat protein
LALEASRKGFNTEFEIDALFQIANSNGRLNNLDDAITNCMQAAQLAEEIDYRFAGHIKATLARLLRKAGRDDEVPKYSADAIEKFEEMGFEWLVAGADNEVASALLHSGSPEKSFEKAQEAFHLADYNENAREMDKAQFIMARSKNQLGEHAEALAIIEDMKARRNFGKRTKHKLRTDLEHVSALTGLMRGEEALKLVDKIVPVMKAYKFKHEVAEALALQARLYFFADNHLDAEQTAIEALMLTKEYGLDKLEVDVTYLLAACYELLGRPEDRAHYLQQITSNPLNVGYQEYWFAASELALHFALTANPDAAGTYIDLSQSGSPLVNDAVSAQCAEAQAILLGAAGQKVKAKNMAGKAMQTYLLSGNTGAATRVAQWVKNLG